MATATISPPTATHFPLLRGSSSSCNLPLSLILPFPSLPSSTPFRSLALRSFAARIRSSLGPQDPALLRRPLVSSPSDDGDDKEEKEEKEEEEDGNVVSSGISEYDGEDDGIAVARRTTAEEARGNNKSSRPRRSGQEWVDWEDQILEDTVPLVGFVRMLLHSGKYESGDKLNPEHEKKVMERLLPYHPEFEKKIGCGIDFITIGYHPDFENSRCLFIVRKDGVLVDFSYWKCIKGLIRKNYPLYADSFILRHFRRRRNNE